MHSVERIKYSDNFLRDYHWYLNVSHIFTFSGTDKYTSKKGHELIIHSYTGKSAKHCFYKFDTNGVIIPTAANAEYPKGFGGKKFKIQRLNSNEIIETDNLWHRGKLPNYYKGDNPDTVKFI